MKHIYTYGLEKTQRNLTLPDIRANKSIGKKMTQATATNGEEAAAVEAAGIDMLGLVSTKVKEARAAAPYIYTIAAIEPELAVTDDEVLREAFRAVMAGADQLYTIRGPRIVEMLAREGFSVHGHVGLVPRRSVATGGLRAMGKTADEALSILADLRRLEDAGAVAAEVECVASEAMAAISLKTSLVTHAIGSGYGADVIFMFTDDICGDNPDPPRHARAFGNMAPLRDAVAAERLHALSDYREAVDNGTFPDESESVSMSRGEHARLAELLEKY
jgi:3-methyl-2-oxobutanoate hydroxymethyltransferase